MFAEAIVYTSQCAPRCKCRHIKERTGLRAECITYKIRKQSLHQAASKAAADVKNLAPEDKPVFAVACSLGSVVLRHMMALPDKGGINWAGCVLIVPPSQGRCSVQPGSMLIDTCLKRSLMYESHNPSFISAASLQVLHQGAILYSAVSPSTYARSSYALVIACTTENFEHGMCHTVRLHDKTWAVCTAAWLPGALLAYLCLDGWLAWFSAKEVVSWGWQLQMGSSGQRPLSPVGL